MPPASFFLEGRECVWVHDPYQLPSPPPLPRPTGMSIARGPVTVPAGGPVFLVDGFGRTEVSSNLFGQGMRYARADTGDDIYNTGPHPWGMGAGCIPVCVGGGALDLRGSDSRGKNNGETVSVLAAFRTARTNTGPRLLGMESSEWGPRRKSWHDFKIATISKFPRSLGKCGGFVGCLCVARPQSQTEWRSETREHAGKNHTGIRPMAALIKVPGFVHMCSLCIRTIRVPVISIHATPPHPHWASAMS